jgi:4-hydroxybenzoate polyprenyltransferase
MCIRGSKGGNGRDPTADLQYDAHVRRLLLRIITAIQLTRLTIAFGAVSDIWFVILYTRARPEYEAVGIYHLGGIVALLTGAVVAVGLFAYGAALNDVLDVRHDTTFSPERPIPAGRIKVGQAVVVAVGSLIVAVLGGVGMGPQAVYITLFTAAVVLFYNATGKYIPAVGAITIGLVHAAHMFIPNHQLSFTLPVWLIMTHTCAISAAVHVLEDKRPAFNRRAIIATVIGWAFWSALILGRSAFGEGGLWPEDADPIGLVYPAIVIVAFFVVVRWKAVGVQGSVAAEKLKRYGAMWQSLYGAAWLLALGLRVEAFWIGLFAFAGFTAMTLIKEMRGLTDRPVSYRA